MADMEDLIVYGVDSEHICSICTQALEIIEALLVNARAGELPIDINDIAALLAPIVILMRAECGRKTCRRKE